MQAKSSNEALLQLMLQRKQGVKGAVLADEIGVDESTVSRIFAGDAGVKLNRLPAFLAALGLKIVSADSTEIHPAMLQCLTELAEIGLSAFRKDTQPETNIRKAA